MAAGFGKTSGAAMALAGAATGRAERRAFSVPPGRGAPRADSSPVPLSPRMAAMRDERWGELLGECNALAARADVLLLRFRLLAARAAQSRGASGPAGRDQP